MAISTCIKCGSHSFEVTEYQPIGSTLKFMFLQCAQCGGVVGVMDYYNIGSYVRSIAAKLGVE